VNYISDLERQNEELMQKLQIAEKNAALNEIRWNEDPDKSDPNTLAVLYQGYSRLAHISNPEDTLPKDRQCRYIVYLHAIPIRFNEWSYDDRGTTTATRTLEGAKRYLELIFIGNKTHTEAIKLIKTPKGKA
jgi:hypothetical protein